MSDNYHRLLLRKGKDKELLLWLIRGRWADESHGNAARRNLYRLMKMEKDAQRVEMPKQKA